MTNKNPQDKHTEEPWSLYRRSKLSVQAVVLDGQVQIVANCGGSKSTQVGLHDEMEANAQRIVTCVNEFAGIENPKEFMEEVRKGLKLIGEGYEEYDHLDDAATNARELLALFPKDKTDE